MALVVADRIKETTTTTGTGAVSLAGAQTNFRTFSSVLSNTDTTYYAIIDNVNFDFEVGLGTYASSGNTITRTTVLSSSNSNSAVNFGAGTKDIILTYPADKAVVEEADGKVVIDGNVSIESGLIDLKNAGTASQIKFYCESSNQHAQTVQGAPHASAASNTLVLPATGDNLVSDSATQTLTNKTLTSPKINEDVAVTSTATEINLLDGVTATTTEINYVDGVTSAIQTQIDSKNALPIIKSANYTAAVGEFVVVSAGSITITLPSSPSAGNTVTIKDGTGAAATTTFAVARNGSNIASSASDLTFDKNFAEITMTYIDGTIGWSV